MEGCALCGVHTTSLCTNKYSNKRVKNEKNKNYCICVCGARVCFAVVLAVALHRCGLLLYFFAAVGNYGYFLRFFRYILLFKHLLCAK